VGWGKEEKGGKATASPAASPMTTSDTVQAKVSSTEELLAEGKTAEEAEKVGAAQMESAFFAMAMLAGSAGGKVTRGKKK
jgi:hypothetical protein